MSSIRLAAAMLLFCALAACGGGGGGGSDGGTGGNGNGGGDGLSVSPTSLTFSFSNGTQVPASQDVAVTVTNSAAAFAGAAYAPGVTPAPWLAITVTGAVPNFVFHFSASPAGLQAGTYSTTVGVGIARADGSVITHRDVTVTMTVAATMSLSSAALTFDHIHGASAPQAKAVTVTGNTAVAWTAAANQPWVTLGATSGTTPTTTNIGINPAGLAAGNYSATVTFSGAGETDTVNVGLTITAPVIVPGHAQLSFGGINGSTLPGRALEIQLNNAVPVPWSATSSAPWLVLSSSSGTTPQTITVSANPANGALASGDHDATISIDAIYAGATLHFVVDASLSLVPATLTVSPSPIELGGADGGDTSATAVQLSLDTGANAFPWSVSGLATGAQASVLSGTVSATAATLGLQPSTTIDGNTS